MFTARTKWNLSPNELSIRLGQRRQAGLPIIDLTESNPTRCQFQYAKEEILAALSGPCSLSYAPQPKGDLPARHAVTRYYVEKGIRIDPEQVILTASTSEAYSFLFRLLADPDDTVLVPRPSYPLFDFLAALNDVRLEPYPLVYDTSWRIDLEALQAAITPRSRALLVVHPNNPTGSFLHSEDIPTLMTLCRRHDLAIISDEVFSDYVFKRSAQSIASLAGISEVLVFALNGLSKLVGLPQLKLSWICANGPETLLQDALRRLEVIADTYLSVNTPVQCALPSLLAGRHAIQNQILTRVRSNRDYLLNKLGQTSPCQCLEVEGGWYAVLRVPRTHSEEEWALEMLDKDGVLVHPGYFFDFESEGYLVIGLLPPGEIFREGVERILARIEREG